MIQISRAGRGFHTTNDDCCATFLVRTDPPSIDPAICALVEEAVTSVRGYPGKLTVDECKAGVHFVGVLRGREPHPDLTEVTANGKVVSSGQEFAILHVESFGIRAVVSGSAATLLCKSSRSCGSAQLLSLLHTSEIRELEGQNDRISRGDVLDSTTCKALAEGQGWLLSSNRDNLSSRIGRRDDDRWQWSGAGRRRRHGRKQGLDMSVS